MKGLLVAATLALALPSTAWFSWAFVTERSVTNWLADRADEGWVAHTEAVSVDGFPTDFVTEIVALNLADPSTGWAWSAPHLTLSQSAFDLGRTTTRWPSEQVLSSPFERLTIRADELVSDLALQPFNGFALDRSETQMADLSIESTEGWQMTLARGVTEMTRQPETETTYALRFEATEFTPPEDVARRLDPGGVLPDAIPTLRSDAIITFDRSWDITAIEISRPQPTRIELTEARAEWGELLLRTSGTLEIDDQGRATGEIAIRAENWEEMVSMATRAGVLSDAIAATARTALGFLAGLSGRPENLDVTLQMEDGFVYLGPLPIGEAPPFRLR